MKNSIRIQNLQRIIDEKFKSWRALSIAIGKLPSYMNEIKNGKREFTPQLVEHIETTLSLKTGTLDYTSEYNDKEPLLVKIDELDFSTNMVITFHYINQQYLTQANVKTNSTKIFTMPDNSMNPTLSSGAKVLINTQQIKLVDNKIFLIKFDQRIVLRKTFITKPKQELILKSINADYPEQIVSIDNIEIIGQAIGLVWQSFE